MRNPGDAYAWVAGEMGGGRSPATRYALKYK